MGKHNVVLFSHKREGNPTVCDNMDERGLYAHWNKPDTEDKYYITHESKIVKPTETRG